MFIGLCATCAECLALSCPHLIRVTSTFTISVSPLIINPCSGDIRVPGEQWPVSAHTGVPTFTSHGASGGGGVEDVFIDSVVRRGGANIITQTVDNLNWGEQIS